MWTVVLAAALAIADPKSASPELGAQAFGADLVDVQDVTIAALVARPDEYLGKNVRVRGVVVDVGEKDGASLTIASDNADGLTIRISLEEGAPDFLMDARGRRVVVEGVFTTVKKAREGPSLSLETTEVTDKVQYRIRASASGIKV